MNTIYVVEHWDDCCEIGESYFDDKAYRTKESAENRARQIEEEGKSWGAKTAIVELEVVDE